MSSSAGTRIPRIPAANGATPPAEHERERRIAACLKACDGIPTERLENHAILRLVAACIHTTDPDIRAAVEALVPLPSPLDDGRRH